MGKQKYFEEFFIDDEKTFEKEQVLNLLEKCKQYAKLIGKKGSVHLVAKGLTLTDKSKLFLITRYLGEELRKLEPSLEIQEDISSIYTKELAKFLNVDEPNARTRMSDLIKEGFAIKPKKGVIQVKPLAVEEFLEKLKDSKLQKKDIAQKKFSKKINKNKDKKSSNVMSVDIKKIYKRLSTNLNINEKILEDSLLIKEDGSFKFNKLFSGKSKHAIQIKCILCSAYVITVGIGIKNFSSKFIKDICYHSNVDISGLNYAIREMKNKDYITKSNRRSQQNIILEKGKKEAINIFKEICSNN